VDQGLPGVKRMRTVIPGGSGQVGTILARHLHALGHEVIVLSRQPKPAPWQTVWWNGKTLDPAWTELLEGADAVIHLSGRSVNCRYNAANRREIIDSRVVPTRLIGQAIEQSKVPPKVWMNASTSTFYRHALDRPQDELTGELGGNEPGVPETWNFSIDVARRWEEAFYASTTPGTRKIALRSSMTMSPDAGPRGRASSSSRGFTSGIIGGLSTFCWPTTRFAVRLTSRRRIRYRTGSSCGNFAARPGFGSGFLRRPGCWRLGRTSCGQRPS